MTMVEAGQYAIPACPGYTEGAIAMRTRWLLEARDAQLPSRAALCARIWWIRSGRGYGKSRSCLEWAVDMCRRYAGIRCHVVAATAGDLKATVFEGDSGLTTLIADDEYLGGSQESGYNISEHAIRFANGSKIFGFSAERPSRMRGPQCHIAVAEEISSWERAQEAYDMLELGLRLPFTPKMIEEGGPVGALRMAISSTPKRNAITKKLAADPAIHVTTGSTDENRENLDPAYIERVINKYEGTELGKQELHGHILNDTEGAMWKTGWIQTYRYPISLLTFSAVRVGWDPAVTSEDKSDLHGIVAAARIQSIDMSEIDPLMVHHVPMPGDIIVLADRSGNLSPVAAARRVIALAKEFDAQVIHEDNQGKDTWRSVWREAGGRESDIRITSKSAVKSKEMRAMPVSLMYEKAANLEISMSADNRIIRTTRIWHVPGLVDLEDEMTTWNPAETAKSPNRIDGLVWSMFGLGIGKAGQQRAGSMSSL